MKNMAALNELCNKFSISPGGRYILEHADPPLSRKEIHFLRQLGASIRQGLRIPEFPNDNPETVIIRQVTSTRRPGNQNPPTQARR